jgi:hypothetical protein
MPCSNCTEFFRNQTPRGLWGTLNKNGLAKREQIWRKLVDELASLPITPGQSRADAQP